MAVKRAFLLDALWPALLAFLLYLPSLGGPTIWDDHDLLMNNTRVQEMTVRGAFTTDFWDNARHPERQWHIAHYRPLALLAYTAVLRVFGMDPVAVHLADVMLHALATFAFFCLLSGLRLDRKICWMAAFFFAVHPLHVEAAAWISGMSETLAAATLLGSLAFYVYGKRDWSLLFAAGAMLMKEGAIAIPALIFILEWWRGSPQTDSVTGSGPNASHASHWRSAAWAAAPYVPLALTYWIVRSAIMPPPPLPPGKIQELFWAGVPFIPGVAGRYVALLFFPWPMAFSYDLHAWKIPLLGLGIAGTWMAIAWRVKTLRHDLLLPGALVLIFLSVPVVSSPLMSANLEIQDRYAYLATTGACLALALLLNRLGSRWPRVVLSLGIGLVVLGATATLLQERVWRSEEAMWANTVKLTPSSIRARYQLFSELARLQRPAEALRVCQEGRVYHPEQTMFRDCLGLSKLGLDYLQKHPRIVVITNQ